MRAGGGTDYPCLPFTVGGGRTQPDVVANMGLFYLYFANPIFRIMHLSSVFRFAPKHLK